MTHADAAGRSTRPGMGRRGPRPTRPSGMSVGALLVAVVLAAGLVAGCGSGGASAAPSASAGARAEGLVVDVVASGPVEVSSFTIRTADGQTMTFTVGALDLTGGGFPGEHLSEHRIAAEPVAVLYRDEGGVHVAYKLLDATATPSPS